MRLSVVIATKDRAALLEDALASLRAQQGAPDFEVIVVDNGSSDATREVAQRYGARYRYVEEPNRALARNDGLEIATGDIIVFIDDDVVTSPHFLAAHAAAHERSSVPLCVSGPIMNVASARQKSSPRFYNGSRAFLVTCNVSVGARELNAVGRFDETFNLYGWEDSELGRRLRKSGVRRHFAWNAHLQHIKPPTLESLDAALRKHTEKAKMARLFVRKHPDFNTKLATGAYALNLLRARVFLPPAIQPLLAGLATSTRSPNAVAQLARKFLLDSVYAEELDRQLRTP